MRAIAFHDVRKCGVKQAVPHRRHPPRARYDRFLDMPDSPLPSPPALARKAPGLAHPERSFGLGAPSPPAALPPTSPPGAHRRDFGLRLALYAIVLGAVLTMVTAFVLARQDALVGVDAAGFATYHRVLVPLLAVAAIAGVLL